MVPTSSLLIISCALVSHLVHCGHHSQIRQQRLSTECLNDAYKHCIVDVLVNNPDQFSTLITAIKKIEFWDLVRNTLSNGGPFTLFAPNNDAFAALPEGALVKLLAAPEDFKDVLMGHVVPGNHPVALIRSGDLLAVNNELKKIVASDRGVSIDGSNVIGKEYIVDNGVIHPIDRVIRPKSKSIVDILIKNEQTYSTLVTAVKAVNLVDTLSNGAPFTLFAPTNQAFAALPEGALEKLLADPEALKKVLLSHVVSDSLSVALLRSGVSKRPRLNTLSGSVINVNASAKGVKIDEANVIGNEFLANNGVIHTIDKVL